LVVSGKAASLVQILAKGRGFPAVKFHAVALSLNRMPYTGDSKMRFEYRFLHEAVIRRPRRQRAVRLLYEARASVWLPSVSASEARPAFRISDRQADGRETVTEILQFQDKIWWPMALPQAPDRAVTINRLRAVLFDPNANLHLLGLFPDEECRYANIALENDREIAELLLNTRENVLEAANRKLFENILLCEGIAYTRGGAPILVEDEHRETHFIDPGASRAVELSDDGLFYLSQSLAREENQSIFRAGNMLSARQAAVRSDQLGGPRIEIFQAASDTCGIIDHRVDSCFRSVCREFQAVTENPERLSELTPAMKSELRNRQASVCASSATLHREGDNGLTRVRAVDLKNFVRFVEYAQFDFGRPQLVEQARQTVAAAVAAGHDLREKLAEIDEDFIWSLPDPRYFAPRRPGDNGGGPPADPA
jgi:hypothetical protein